MRSYRQPFFRRLILQHERAIDHRTCCQHRLAAAQGHISANSVYHIFCLHFPRHRDHFAIGICRFVCCRADMRPGLHNLEARCHRARVVSFSAHSDGRLARMKVVRIGDIIIIGQEQLPRQHHAHRRLAFFPGVCHRLRHRDHRVFNTRRGDEPRPADTFPTHRHGRCDARIRHIHGISNAGDFCRQHPLHAVGSPRLLWAAIIRQFSRNHQRDASHRLTAGAGRGDHIRRVVCCVDGRGVEMRRSDLLDIAQFLIAKLLNLIVIFVAYSVSIR